MSADLFAALFLRDPQRRAVLDAVAALALPDWAIVDPVLQADAPLATYACGTWGPPEAEHLLEPGS
jgi:glucose-6-phosphate 1-dehydrogenase